MKARPITPRSQLDAAVLIPGSKSCTARALVMAALTSGTSVLHHHADCDDSTHLLGALRGLGIEIRTFPDRLEIEGKPFVPPAAPLFVGNSGTAMRFLTAACATLAGEVTLDGVARMRERPIRDLTDALAQWGVETRTVEGCPPVSVRSTGVFGGTARVRGSASSQYLTGLLLAAPKAQRGARIEVDGELVSKPYIRLTIAMMAERGVEAVNEAWQAFHVAPNQQYRPGAYSIEADASGASYFFGAAAIAGGRVRVANLAPDSHQGDARFPEVLAQMGCRVETGPGWIEVIGGGDLRGIDADLNAMPDMAQTLAVIALFASGPTTIRNVANLRIKECDRIAATAAELRKLGAEVAEFDDGLRIIPPDSPRPAAIDTYDDHRMAMSFAMAGLRIPGVEINDPGCVSKTFPDFFERFEALGA